MEGGGLFNPRRRELREVNTRVAKGHPLNLHHQMETGRAPSVPLTGNPHLS